MRLPWQKDQSAAESKGGSLKEKLALGNSSTGSFFGPPDSTRISKIKKEQRKSVDGSSSEDASPSISKKSPNDDPFKNEKSSLDVPKAQKHRRKSIDVASLGGDDGLMDFQKNVQQSNSDEVIPSQISVSSSSKSSTIVEEAVVKEKKKKKVKGLGPKPPKIGKDGKLRKVVSFAEYDERSNSNGTIDKRPLNTHECAKGEIPYHKRGKEEYRLKRHLLKQANASQDNAEEEPDYDVEEENPPSFNILISSEDDAEEANKVQDMTSRAHSIKLQGPIPQSISINNIGSAVTLHSFSISRYSPDIKGILVIENSQRLIPASDESHFFKTDVHMYFDDWDTKKSVNADLMDIGVLNMLLKSSGKSFLGSKNDIFLDKNEVSEKTGLIFSIPIDEIFLPSLYEMLSQMGMETNQSTFEVEGVIVLFITVYKSTSLFRGSSIELACNNVNTAIDKLNDLTLKNSLSNERLSSLEGSTTDLGPHIQITRSSVTEKVDDKNASAPELPGVNDSDPKASDSSLLSSSADNLAVWKIISSIGNSKSGSPTGSPSGSTIVSKPVSEEARSKSSSGSILNLEDQLLLSAKFEIQFTVEKNPNGVVHSFDLLHVGYQQGLKK